MDRKILDKNSLKRFIELVRNKTKPDERTIIEWEQMYINSLERGDAIDYMVNKIVKSGFCNNFYFSYSDECEIKNDILIYNGKKLCKSDNYDSMTIYKYKNSESFFITQYIHIKCHKNHIKTIFVDMV